MSIELLGNIIAVGAILIVCMVVCAVMKYLLDEPIHDDYKYCHDCKYGLCFENPKESKCQKWLDEQRGEKE